MLSLLSTVRSADLDVLFIILAIIAFGCAIWQAVVSNFLAAGACLIVAVVLCIVASG